MPLPPSQDDVLTVQLSKTFSTLIQLGQPYFACWKYVLGPPTSADPFRHRLQTSKIHEKGLTAKPSPVLAMGEVC